MKNTSSVFEVQQVQKVQQDIKHEVHKQQKVSREKLREELFFKTHNRRHKNGRIYGFFDENGDKVTFSISPDYEKFDTQIEEGVYPHVMALKDRGYFTISSCQGHPYNMYIKIGFGTNECREHFIKAYQSAKIPFVRHILRDVEINSAAKLSDEGKVIGKYRYQQEGSKEYLRKAQSDNFNLQFNTHFDNWYILDLYLLRDSSWLLHPIRRIKELLGVKNKAKYSEQLLDFFNNLEHYNDVYSRNYLDSLVGHS
ncbi:hypothetical protein [Vibrio crassostreae]|uniref:hypothetical protein n=1 Tax=Vibrio crassostreae TaxID=246167 RepID=UPI001B30FF84|nr:hypothetical protein [Vibrio crassostreae]